MFEEDTYSITPLPRQSSTAPNHFQGAIKFYLWQAQDYALYGKEEEEEAQDFEDGGGGGGYRRSKELELTVGVKLGG